MAKFFGVIVFVLSFFRPISFLVLSFLILLGEMGHGQTSTAESNPNINQSTSSAHHLHNQKFAEDKAITDLEIRARAGSMSKFSSKFDLSYDGAGITDLGDSVRPNPDNRPGDFRTRMVGSIGLRYRMDSAKALEVNTGLTWFNPVEAVGGRTPDREELAKKMNVRDSSSLKSFDLNNPSLNFDNTESTGAWQFRSAGRVMVTTSKTYTDGGQLGSLRAQQVAKYFFGEHREWVAGADLALEGWVYSRAFDGSNRADRRLSSYQWVLIPNVDYRLTEKLNLQNSMAWTYANQRAADRWGDLERMGVTFRTGLGWSYTKEVYFKTYVHFPSVIEEGFSAKTATVGLSSVFSIF